MKPLHCAITGNPDGAPLVLLHAIGTSGAMWGPQMLAWAARFRLIAVDLPGHGESPPLPEGADFGDYAQAVGATLSGLGIASASVVGLSFGAMVAMRLAHERPDLVRSLVLANGVAVAPPPVRDAWRDRIATVRQSGVDAIADATLGRWFTPEFAAKSPLTIDAVKRMVLATSAEGFIGAARAISTLDHTHLLAGITCPTLVVSGQHDAAAPQAQVAHIATRIQQARLLSLEAPHMSNIECADTFTEQVGDFLIRANDQ